MYLVAQLDGLFKQLIALNVYIWFKPCICFEKRINQQEDQVLKVIRANAQTLGNTNATIWSVMKKKEITGVLSKKNNSPWHHNNLRG